MYDLLKVQSWAAWFLEEQLYQNGYLCILQVCNSLWRFLSGVGETHLSPSSKETTFPHNGATQVSSDYFAGADSRTLMAGI